MELKLRVFFPVLIGIQLFLIIIHLLFFVAPSYAKVDHAKSVDTGIIQKRLNNVNFYYIPNAGDTTLDTRYPRGESSNPPRRIGLPKISNCPPFRLSDDNKSVIVG